MQKLLLVCYQKIAPQAKSEKYFQIWFFPRFRGKKWRRSEHAHASYPGLFFRPPGFSPYMGREERRVQGLDYTLVCLCFIPLYAQYISVHLFYIVYTVHRCVFVLYRLFILTLFRPGFFGQSVTGGGAPQTPPLYLWNQ